MTDRDSLCSNKIEIVKIKEHLKSIESKLSDIIHNKGYLTIKEKNIMNINLMNKSQDLNSIVFDIAMRDTRKDVDHQCVKKDDINALNDTTSAVFSNMMNQKQDFLQGLSYYDLLTLSVELLVQLDSVVVRSRVFGYTRVSTKKQAEHGLSIHAQEHQIKLYCHENELTLNRIFTDLGVSGKSIMNRPGMSTLLTDLQPGDTYIVSTVCRLGRNKEDNMYIRNLMERNHCELIILNHFDIDLSNLSNDPFEVASEFSEMESRVTSQRVKLALNYKKSQNSSEWSVEKIIETDRVQKIKCSQNCEECFDQLDPCKYCEKCPICIVRRKEAVRFKMQQERHRLRAMQTPIKHIIQPREGKILHDQYYSIELTAFREDGSNEHIRHELLRVFNRMHPLSSDFKLAAYVIDMDDNDVPRLNGLIRYGDNPNNHISPSTSIFRGKINRQGYKESNERPRTVVRLTKHVKKCYETDISAIEEKYNKLTEKGSVTGSSLEDFLKV